MLSRQSLLWMLWLFFHATTFAQSYYVCQSCGNANDTNNPGTFALPWRTIGRACLSNAVPVGSTVYIRAGTYVEKLTVNVSGAVNQPITFRPYATDVVRIEGNNTPGVLLTIRNQSYVTFDSLQFQNAIGSNSGGIHITGNSRNIIIRNCLITNIAFHPVSLTPSSYALDNAHGILVKGDDPSNAITNLLIQRNTLDNIRPGYSEGLTLVGNVDGFEVSDNIISNIANIGLVVAGHYVWACTGCAQTSVTQNQARRGTVTRNQVSSCRGPLALAAGIYADGSRDLIIEQNIVRDCQRGFQIACENQNAIAGATASNIILRNNLAYQNARAGIGLGSSTYDVHGGKVVSCSVVNNSLFDNFINRVETNQPIGIQDFGEVTLYYSENCVIENNIFHAGNRERLLNSYAASSTLVAQNLRFNYNLWFTNYSNPLWVYFSTPYYSFADFRTGAGQENNGRFGNPQYTSISPPVLTLGISSSAINIGNPLATTSLSGSADYENKPRFRAGRVDAGAYEFPRPVVSMQSGLWHITGNWDCNCVPTRFDAAQILPAHTLTIDGNTGPAHVQQLLLRGRLNYLNRGRLMLFAP